MKEDKCLDCGAICSFVDTPDGYKCEICGCPLENINEEKDHDYDV